jgi:hypothetical protein
MYIVMEDTRTAYTILAEGSGGNSPYIIAIKMVLKEVLIVQTE